MFFRLFAYAPIFLFLAFPALAAERPLPARKPLEPRVEVNWRHSNDRSILMSEFWVPIAQNEIDGSVIYGDLRLMGDNGQNREFNVGVGYRKMVENTLLGEGIIGAHAWYDRRLTKRGSKFNQITAGMEWFGEIWDAKLNAYMPLNKDKTHSQANGAGSGARFAGNQIVVNTDQSVVEEALPGLDLELGWKVPFMENFTDSTRIYVGGYHFEGDRADDITGWRTRIVSDITSDVQLGARFQRDAERGSQAFVEATVRFPFGSKQSFKEKGLRARLDESPERDIDIVAAEAITDQGTNQTLLNATTGGVQNVIHVDNTVAGGGDGSIENPFNTLAAAEGAATTNDLIYVHRGDGTTTGQANGITLDDEGQMLIGSGANLTYSSGRFRTSNGMDVSDNILIPADPLGAPVITNGAGNGVSVTSDDILISGVTTDGATTSGVYVHNTSGTTWTKGITIQSVTSQNNTSDGFWVNLNGAGNAISNVAFTDNTANMNGRYGFYTLTNNGGSISQANFINNTSRNNALDGFFSNVINAGSAITNMNFTNNVADNNVRHGFFEIAQNSGTIGQATFTGNISDTNGQHGFYAQATGAGSAITNITFTDNIADNSGSHGFWTFAQSGASIGQANLVDNISQNNTSNGFYTLSTDAGSAITSANFINNIADTNGGSGFYTVAQTQGAIGELLFERNTSKDNSVYGFNFDSNNTAAGITTADMGGGALGSTGNNQAFGNVNRELFVDLDGGNLMAENNWWGSASGLTGGELLLQDASTADTTPFLTSAP